MWLCPECQIVFKDESAQLSLPAEKERYLLHHNGKIDEGYRSFLEQVLNPALSLKPPNEDWKILDYGSGPSPALQTLLNQKGLACEIYDPFFAPKSLELSHWDLIFCTEVAEHFRAPLVEWQRLRSLCKPRGYLAFMTQFHPYGAHEKTDFWWYAEDPTHLSFYNEKTFSVIAERLKLQILVMKNPVVIFQALV